MQFSVSEDCFHNTIEVVQLTEQDILDLIDGKTLETRFTNPKLFVLRIVNIDSVPQYKQDVSSVFEIQNSPSS